MKLNHTLVVVRQHTISIMRRDPYFARCNVKRFLSREEPFLSFPSFLSFSGNLHSRPAFTRRSRSFSKRNRGYYHFTCTWRARLIKLNRLSLSFPHLPARNSTGVISCTRPCAPPLVCLLHTHSLHSAPRSEKLSATSSFHPCRSVITSACISATWVTYLSSSVCRALSHGFHDASWCAFSRCRVSK